MDRNDIINGNGKCNRYRDNVHSRPAVCAGSVAKVRNYTLTNKYSRQTTGPLRNPYVHPARRCVGARVATVTHWYLRRRDPRGFRKAHKAGHRSERCCATCLWMRFQLCPRRDQWSVACVCSRLRNDANPRLPRAGPRVCKYECVRTTYRKGARGCRASGARAARRDCGAIWGSGRIFSWCAVVWGSSVLGWRVVSVAWAGGAAPASRAPAAAARECTSPWPAAAGPGYSSRTSDKPRSWTCTSSIAHARKCRSVSSSCPCQRACYSWDRWCLPSRSPAVDVSPPSLQQEWSMLILFWL